MYRLALLVAVLLVAVSCGQQSGKPPSPQAQVTTPTPQPTATQIPTPTPQPTCSLSDGRKVRDALGDVVQEWLDAVNVASETSRLTLAPQVAELQRIRRTVNQMDWPDCATAAKVALVGSMDSTINGFLAFMANKPDSEVKTYFDQSAQSIDIFKDEMQKLP